MVRKIEDPNEGTNQISSDGIVKRKNHIIDIPIIPAKASEINLPFNAYLTFAMYDPNFIPERMDYVRQLYTPINGEKRIIPISLSFDLVKLLKREEHPLSKYKINPFDLDDVIAKTK
ncbi:MAG: hypothetical protein Q8N88_01490 [Nanoarchaeota archaeon]|nr:hypothetical protein [Nanoarchaeota archaeon]